jgi:hypothetical protein
MPSLTLLSISIASSRLFAMASTEDHVLKRSWTNVVKTGVESADATYWEYFVKGRKAWEKKYLPGIPHGGRYRVYLHTPEGPVERVPAWASYVLPGKLDEQPSRCGEVVLHLSSK